MKTFEGRGTGDAAGRDLLGIRQADAKGDGVTHGVGHRGVEVGVPDDLVELLAAGVALDQHLDADLLEAHLGRLLLGAAGSPGGGVADIPLQEDLQAAQLDLLPGSHGGDAHRQAAAQAGEHDLARRRRGIFAEQVQGLVHHHLVPADVADGAVLPFGDGVDLVGAPGGRVAAALLGEAQQAVTVDGAQLALHGGRCVGKGIHGLLLSLGR
ncbi:hypothetical protein HALA3H3_p60006 [Halomonas sp. A3H3]|nr:hypothetical protein HALA3H3_p60006 [Halomonas sp. A3H3]